MTAIVTAPFIPIAKNLSSHRAAQGVIYADQLKQAGRDVLVNMSLDLYHADHNKFDEMYVYHGNDWSGHLNLFGGLKEFPHVDNFLNFSKFKGKVYSLAIDFPNYYDQLKHKVDLAQSKDKTIDPRWNEVDWNNVKRMEVESVKVDTNQLVKYDRAAMGDSHAICMYRPGWMINSVPFKTLHGALKMGLRSFFPSNEIKFKQLEYYFGNIDVRHHLLRQSDPKEAVRELVREYFRQAEELSKETKARVTIYELLPIENERRHIPKTGWYEGTPFFGTWQQRNDIRLYFRDECRKFVSNRVKFFEWTDKLSNHTGELDFKYMEKPQSVHLSREFYPHWQGWEWNQLELPLNTPTSESTLECFL